MTVIRYLPLDEFVARIGDAVHPILSILVERGAGEAEGCVLTALALGDSVHPRAVHGLEYLTALWRIHRQAYPGALAAAEPRLFQAEDNPIDARSISWERRKPWTSVSLVPDLYYFFARGYEDEAYPQPDWADRAPAAFWRGSSTGILGLTPDNLESLARYRLCRIANGMGARADIKLSAIVQATNAANDEAIKARIASEGLLGPFVPMEAQNRFRLLIDIDGNANAWNFMAKLRLGSCVLRVNSDWEQWFAARLMPWEHYVPVAADLSDLEERIDWCLANDDEARRIAAGGRAFARGMSFADEMQAAARTVFGG